jgi:hypothetical protein
MFGTKREVTSIALCALAIALATQAPTAAQLPVPEPVTQVRVAVWEPETRFEQLNVVAGEPVPVTVGEPVMLRLFQPATDQHDRAYLSGSYSVETGQGLVELSQHEPDRGVVVVTVPVQHGAAAVEGQISLRYQLHEGVPVARRHLVSGDIPLQVSMPPQAPPQAQAVELVEALYRGILLRDADPEGRDPRARRIAEGGYPAIVEVAREIAASRESQIDVPQRATAEERLLALYTEILQRDREEIDVAGFRGHLERIRDGEITEVVTGMVRSAEFRHVHFGHQMLGRSPRMR